MKSLNMKCLVRGGGVLGMIAMSFATSAFARIVEIRVDPNVDLSELVEGEEASTDVTVVGFIADENPEEEPQTEEDLVAVEEEAPADQSEVASEQAQAPKSLDERVGALKEENVRLQARLRKSAGRPESPELAREFRREKRKNNLLRMRVDAREFRKGEVGTEFRRDPTMRYEIVEEENTNDFMNIHRVPGQLIVYVGSQITQVSGNETKVGGLVGGRYRYFPAAGVYYTLDQHPDVKDAGADIKIVFGNSTVHTRVPVSADAKGHIHALLATANGFGGYFRPGASAIGSVNSYDQLAFRKKGGTFFKFGLQGEVEGGLSYSSGRGRTLVTLGPSVVGLLGAYQLDGGFGGRMYVRHRRFEMEVASRHRFHRSGESVWLEDRDSQITGGVEYVEYEDGWWGEPAHTNVFFEERKGGGTPIYYGPFRARSVELEGTLYWRLGKFIGLGVDVTFRRILRKKTNVLNDPRWDAPQQVLTVTGKVGGHF